MQYEVVILYVDTKIRTRRYKDIIDPFVKMYKKDEDLIIDNGFAEYTYKLDDILSIALNRITDKG